MIILYPKFLLYAIFLYLCCQEKERINEQNLHHERGWVRMSNYFMVVVYLYLKLITVLQFVFEKNMLMLCFMQVLNFSQVTSFLVLSQIQQISIIDSNNSIDELQESCNTWSSSKTQHVVNITFVQRKKVFLK